MKNKEVIKESPLTRSVKFLMMAKKRSIRIMGESKATGLIIQLKKLTRFIDYKCDFVDGICQIPSYILKS